MPAGRKKGARIPATQEAARRRSFYDTWLTNGRKGKDAAMAVGISEASACSMASQWLKLPEFVEELARIDKQAREKSEITVEEQLRRLNHIAGVDIQGIYNEDGTVMHPKDWPEGPRLALASMEIEELRGTDEEGNPVVVGHLKKFKFWDKRAAIVDIMKHFPDGFAATKLEVKDTTDYGARMQAMVEREAKALAERTPLVAEVITPEVDE